MNTYAIYEGNLERLEKKINTIKNKCEKYNLEFHYQQVGEEFRPVTTEDNEEVTVRYVLVEVEGKIIHNDWEFVAVVAHEPAGNIIRQMKQDIDVPEKYYTTEPICEHCNTKRRRKDTYLIHNTSTDEWKQVGKSCLNEFTNGMDAELVASYIALFNEVIEGESFGGGSSFERYDLTEDIVAYALETVKHFGYQPANEWENYPTRARCYDYYAVLTGQSSWLTAKRIQELKEEMELVSFDADSSQNREMAKAAIAWAVAQDDSNNSYIHNLKVICSSEYVSGRNLGILISLGQTYRRHIQAEEAKIQRQSEHAEEAAASNFVGSEGERITFKAVDLKVVYVSESAYGICFMYKFHDENGNVFMWSTGNALDEDYSYSVTGTVRKHEEFNGVKQTWVTRCRTTQLEKVTEDEVHPEGTFDADEIMKVFES